MNRINELWIDQYLKEPLRMQSLLTGVVEQMRKEPGKQSL